MRNYRESFGQYRRYFQKVAVLYRARADVRMGFELLLTFFAISFFALFAIRPTILTIFQLVSDIKSQQEIETALSAKVDSLRAAQGVWDKENVRLTFLEQAIPGSPKPDQAVGQLSSLSAKHGVVLESLNVGKTLLVGKPNKAAKKDTLPSFETSFLVKGGYAQTLAFLKDLENLRRVVVVHSISYGPSKKQGEEDTIVLTVGAAIPYFQDDKQTMVKKEGL